MNRLIFAASAAALALAAAPTSAAVLTTGTGDGGVTVTVNATGAFGSATTSVGGNEANYNPVGAIGTAGTTYESYVYLRTAAIGGSFSGARTNLGGLTGTTGASTATSTSSTFSSGALIFNLLQSVNTLLDNANAQTGSLLTQSYTVTNSSNAALQVELTRYLDGDLQFNGSITDGGGRLISNGREILFELDSATGASTGTTFVGIYNEGGASTGYEIAEFSGLRGRIANGTALSNSISGDTNSDGFIDSGYDVTLGMGRSFTIGAGQSFTFTTGTIFGSGAPGQIVVPNPGAVPEAATWAMMLLGFGAMGAALRRRAKVRTTVRFA